MQYGIYGFSNSFTTEALLPEYKGSTFRGVFGISLRNIVCALRQQECGDCLLRRRCLYPFIFETAAFPDHQLFPAGSAGRRRVAAPPHPYVIEPPESDKTRYAEGDSFNFNLILLGKANEYVPYFIYALEQMGRIGVGKRVNGVRGRFVLRDVQSEGTPIYNFGEKVLLDGNFTRDLKADLLKGMKEHENLSVKNVSLSISTPLRIKFMSQLHAELPFHVLVRAMLRRVSILCNYYGNGEPPLDYRGLVERAQAVTISSSTLRWIDWERYSNRQEQAMLMGGLIGDISYQGELSEYLPLMKFCEKVHLGKQSAFGLGKIRVTEVK